VRQHRAHSALDSQPAARLARVLRTALGFTMKTSLFLFLFLFVAAAGANEITEAQALAIAKRYFSKDCTVTLPCSFKTAKNVEGWEVSVQFSMQNSLAEPPRPYPGGHSMLILDSQGKIVKVFPGE
jgi:hypothetical protein